MTYLDTEQMWCRMHYLQKSEKTNSLISFLIRNNTQINTQNNTQKNTTNKLCHSFYNVISATFHPNVDSNYNFQQLSYVMSPAHSNVSCTQSEPSLIAVDVDFSAMQQFQVMLYY